MEGSGGQIFQLAAATLAAVLLFVAAFGLRERTALTILILLLPFQFINSRYGSMNVMLIYLVSVAFVMRGHFKYRPMIFAFLFVLLAYLFSMAQALRATWFDHGTYIISYGANVLVFYLLYNYVRKEEDWGSVWKMLLWLNVLVLVYSTVQLTVGFDRLAPFGISEFSMIQNREDQRLVGPFHATAATAEYLVIQVLLLAYTFLKTARVSTRLVYVALIAGNSFFLVTTGNRGGLFSLIIGMVAFFIMFRREIGLMRGLAIAAMVTVIFGIMAAVAVQYTQFDQLFTRLEQTQVEGFIPDTRKRAWPATIERIAEKPVFGHGPRLRLIDEQNRRLRNYQPLGYPHSVYLHLLVTIGVIGFIAYATLTLMMGLRLARAKPDDSESSVIHGLPRLGLLILFVILVSEIRIEMFRFNLSDYQNIVFAILGIFVGFADVIKARQNSQVAAVAPTIHSRKTAAMANAALSKKTTPLQDGAAT